MSKYTQEDLDKALDQLMAGPIGQKKEWQWDQSARQKGIIPVACNTKEAIKKKVERRKHKQKEINKKIKSNSPLKKPIIGYRVKRVFSTGNGYYKRATIVKIDTIGTFNSITEAAEALQLRGEDIAAVLGGRQKTVKRVYTFEYVKK